MIIKNALDIMQLGNLLIRRKMFKIHNGQFRKTYVSDFIILKNSLVNNIIEKVVLIFRILNPKVYLDISFL